MFIIFRNERRLTTLEGKPSILPPSARSVAHHWQKFLRLSGMDPSGYGSGQDSKE